jgi:NADH-quinone oxidoreductase subunit I
MTNEYELADDSRTDLIFTKEQLLAPLRAGMEQPPHPMRLGETEQAYYAPETATAPEVPSRDGEGRHAAAEAQQSGNTAVDVPGPPGTAEATTRRGQMSRVSRRRKERK